MGKVSSFVKLTAQAGRREELLAALRRMLPVVDGESGTEVYSFHLDRDDENTVWVFELYTDEAALATHSGSDGIMALLADLNPILGSEPPMLVFATPTDAKGLDL